MPDSLLLLLVGLSFVWIGDDTVTVRDGNRNRCRWTRFRNSFRILQHRGTDSRGIAIGVVPDIALVYLGD